MRRKSRTEEQRGSTPRILPASFYARRPDEVAADLVGKLLVRAYGGARLSGVIVEAEAYFGAWDPASRARHRGGSLARAMEWEPGRALVYGVHRQWLLNIVAHPPGEPGAVLIRALEPREGVEAMARLRGLGPGADPRLIASGPGRLTAALGVDKGFHGEPVTGGGRLWVEDVGLRLEVCRCGRVGVSRDLEEPHRYVARGSVFVSTWRGCPAECRGQG